MSDFLGACCLFFLTRSWDQVDSVFGRRAEKPRLATEGGMEGRGRPLAFLLLAGFSVFGAVPKSWGSRRTEIGSLAVSSTFHTVSYFLVLRKGKSLSRVQLFATPWTVALPVSSVQGIFQARILEWVASSFFRRSSRPRE